MLCPYRTSSEKKYSPDYPLGGQVEPYDIREEEKLLEQDSNLCSQYNYEQR